MRTRGWLVVVLAVVLMAVTVPLVFAVNEGEWYDFPVQEGYIGMVNSTTIFHFSSYSPQSCDSPWAAYISVDGTQYVTPDVYVNTGGSPFTIEGTYISEGDYALSSYGNGTANVGWEYQLGQWAGDGLNHTLLLTEDCFDSDSEQYFGGNIGGNNALIFSVESLCVSNWTCSVLEECAPNNVSVCSAVSDANSCGIPSNLSSCIQSDPSVNDCYALSAGAWSGYPVNAYSSGFSASSNYKIPPGATTANWVVDTKNGCIGTVTQNVSIDVSGCTNDIITSSTGSGGLGSTSLYVTYDCGAGPVSVVSCGPTPGDSKVGMVVNEMHWGFEPVNVSSYDESCVYVGGGPTPPTYTLFDGATTDFSTGSDDVSQPVLEKTSYGKIVWDGSNLDFSANDFDSYVLMGIGWVSVDSTNLGVDVNTSAVVSVYGEYVSPAIYRDGVLCDDCVLLSSNSTHQVFSVPHFTNYSIANGSFSLVSPVNDTELTAISGVFVVEVNSSANGTCSLYLDGGLKDSVGFVGSGQYNLSNSTYLQSINDDALVHEWYVDCNGTLSETRVFSVNDTSYPALVKGSRSLVESGRSYIVVGDLNNVTFSGVASGATFDCVGYALNGLGTYNDYLFSSMNGVHVKDCVVMGYTGMVQNSYNVLLTNISSSLMDAMFSNVISNVTVSDSNLSVAYFFFGDSSDGIFVYRNTIVAGSLLFWPNAATVINVEMINNSVVTGTLFNAGGPVSGLFYNNVMNYSSFGSNSGTKYFNTTKQVGVPIAGGNGYIGGNYWINATGSYASSCLDADYDGLCDVPYELVSGVFDYLPLSAGRSLFSGSPNVTAPVANQSERGYVNVTLGSRDSYERINILVGGVTVVANDTDSSVLQFLFNVSAGDRTVTVRSDDVSGLGNVSEVIVPVRVSNLGVVSSVLLDDSVYWLTGGEVPSANIVLSSASGYGAVGVVASLMSGASVLQSKNATAAVDTVYTAPGSVSQGDANGAGCGGVDNVNWQAFYATGDELTEIVTFSPYASDTYKIYEGEGTSGPVVASGLVLSGAEGNNVLSPSVRLVKGGLYTLGSSFQGGFVYRQFVSSVYPGNACYRDVSYATTVDLRLVLKFVDHANLSVNFTGVTNSSENATVSVAVTDTLFNETGSSAVFVLDDLSLPSNVQPSGTTIYTTTLPFNWTASSGGLGAVVYDLVWNVNGTNVSVPGVSGVNWSVSNSQETVNGLAYVRARDSYVNTSYVVNAAPFSVVLSPDMSAVVCAALTYPNEDDLPSAVNLPVNFSVFAPLGFSSPVVSVRLQLGGQVLNGTCGYAQPDSTHRNYACNVSMRYWFAADDYDLNVTFVDGVKNDSVYLSGECTYGALVASKRTTSSIGFPDAGPNIVNSPADVPVVVRNTGNVPLDLFVTGYDLSGRSSPAVKLLASRFKAGASLGSSEELSHGVQKDVSMTVNPSQGAQASILFWLSMPADQLLQDYYAATPWQVVGSG